jgi:hypothetical protein
MQARQEMRGVHDSGPLLVPSPGGSCAPTTPEGDVRGVPVRDVHGRHSALVRRKT